MADLSSVRNATMFEGVTEDEFADLESIARLETAVKGERLFARGKEADKFYIVKEGVFSLTLALRWLDNPFDLAIEEKGAGDALGWSSLVAPYRSIYCCYCIEDGALFSFPRGDLARLMSLDRDLGNRISINLNRLIADRLRTLQSLWIEEIEQSTARIERWSHTEIANHLALALRPPHKESAHGHRLFRRGGGHLPPVHH